MNWPNPGTPGSQMGRCDMALEMVSSNQLRNLGFTEGHMLPCITQQCLRPGLESTFLPQHLLPRGPECWVPWREGAIARARTGSVSAVKYSCWRRQARSRDMEHTDRRKRCVHERMCACACVWGVGQWLCRLVECVNVYKTGRSVCV